MRLLFLPKDMSESLTTESMTNSTAITSDELEPPKDPAFKGSFFTKEDYKDAWGDDWHTLFMQIVHNSGGGI
jgi:hypothetical protein